MLEHGDAGLPLAHLPKKFRLLWREDVLAAAARAGLPAHRGLKRVLWSLKYALRVIDGKKHATPTVFARVRAADVSARLAN